MHAAAAHTRAILRGELRGDVVQAAVTGRAAAMLELNRPRLEVELVVHDQHLLRSDAKEARDRRHGGPASVHERLRHQQAGVAGRRADLRHESIELAFGPKRNPAYFSEPFDKPESRVVPRISVLAPGIAEPDHDTKRLSHRCTRSNKKARRKKPGGPPCL